MMVCAQEAMSQALPARSPRGAGRGTHIICRQMPPHGAIDDHGDLIRPLHKCGVLHLPLQDPAETNSDAEQYGQAEHGETKQ